MPRTDSSCPTTITRRRQSPRARAECSRLRSANRSTTAVQIAVGSAARTYERARSRPSAYETRAAPAIIPTPPRSTRWYSSVPTNRYRRSYARLTASTSNNASGSSADSPRYDRLYAVTWLPNRSPKVAAPAATPAARSQATSVRTYRRSHRCRRDIAACLPRTRTNGRVAARAAADRLRWGRQCRSTARLRDRPAGTRPPPPASGGALSIFWSPAPTGAGLAGADGAGILPLRLGYGRGPELAGGWFAGP